MPQVEAAGAALLTLTRRYVADDDPRAAWKSTVKVRAALQKVRARPLPRSDEAARTLAFFLTQHTGRCAGRAPLALPLASGRLTPGLGSARRGRCAQEANAGLALHEPWLAEAFAHRP